MCICTLYSAYVFAGTLEARGPIRCPLSCSAFFISWDRLSHWSWHSQYAWAVWISRILPCHLTCPYTCVRTWHTHSPSPALKLQTHPHTFVLCGCWTFKPRSSGLGSRLVYWLTHPTALTDFNRNTNHFIKNTGSGQCIFKQKTRSSHFLSMGSTFLHCVFWSIICQSMNLSAQLQVCDQVCCDTRFTESRLFTGRQLEPLGLTCCD